MDLAIIGAGLLGRVLAINLLQEGHRVSLFEKDQASCSGAAGNSAAGMLALFAELESAESIIHIKGRESMKLWPGILEEIGASELMRQNGSLIVAHPQDYGELEHFIESLKAKVDDAKSIKRVERDEIVKLESDLGSHRLGFFIPDEGDIDAQEFFRRSKEYLLGHVNLAFYEDAYVEDIGLYSSKFDFVFDTRGMGANISDLRGVRGEVLHIESDEIKLNRPIRFMHPRYRLYVVPRGENRFIIGATEIESEDRSPISIRSSLELLSALYALSSAFGEARIIKCDTNLRPALSDNLPRISKSENIITINGLYRHGYLLAPAIVKEAMEYMR